MVECSKTIPLTQQILKRLETNRNEKKEAFCWGVLIKILLYSLKFSTDSTFH